MTDTAHDWQSNFAAYTTGFAFNIQLTGDMASLLAYIAAGHYDKWQSRSGRGTFIPTYRSLERRGLAEHNPFMRSGAVRLPNAKPKWIYRATPAGKHVVELLKLAGVVDVIAAANDRAA